MHFTGAEISAWIGSYLWPLFRIGAALGAVPVIGTRMVPIKIRLGLALAVTFVVVPVIPPAPAIDPLSVSGALVSLQQILIGTAMGFTLHMVFGAFVHAGQTVAMQMGLGFASMVDPQHGVQVPMVSQFYVILVTLTFLVLDGHLAMIEMVAGSFRSMPIGSTGMAVAGLWQLVAWGGDMFAGALHVALPAVASLLVVNLAFGVMTRAAPQLNIFAVGFPVTLIMGFAVLLWVLPGVVPQFTGLLGDGLDLMQRLVGGGD